MMHARPTRPHNQNQPPSTLGLTQVSFGGTVAALSIVTSRILADLNLSHRQLALLGTNSHLKILPISPLGPSN
jgi:hypothetical protein